MGLGVFVGIEPWRFSGNLRLVRVGISGFQVHIFGLPTLCEMSALAFKALYACSRKARRKGERWVCDTSRR